MASLAWWDIIKNKAVLKTPGLACDCLHVQTSDDPWMTCDYTGNSTKNKAKWRLYPPMKACTNMTSDDPWNTFKSLPLNGDYTHQVSSP